MYKQNQSSIPQKHSHTWTKAQQVERNMQILTRRLVMNLTKNTLKSTQSAVTQLRRSDAFLQHYSTDRPQQKLLRFPAFPLEDTLSKFLQTAQPFLNAKEFKETEAMLSAFNREEGDELQKLLDNVATEEQNWLASRWLRYAYMQFREPVTVYSSPGMSFPLRKFADDAEYLRYTAQVISALLAYKAKIDKNEIPVTKMGKFELDNSQFERVFGTCRIPQRGEDKLEFHGDSQHIVVIYKNHFYKLPVYNRCGVALHPDILADELHNIMASEKHKGVPFGLLSLDNRDNWAAAYEHLIKSIANNQSVDVIQRALFTVSLDECVPTDCGKEWTTLSEQLIHGGGTKQNSGNRWMDKTIQLIVNPNGMSGFCYEHSPAEGQPIALMTDFMIKELKDQSAACNADVARDNFDCAEKLPLASSTCLDQHIETAQRNTNRLINNLHMNVMQFRDYGKEFIKQQKLSPDSYVQMALQYAFYKLHRVPGAQYESAHLRIYVGGRTETIRSCSNESLAFAHAMSQGQHSDEERVQLLRAAVSAHRAYTNLALQGRGVDRHLLGLKLMALEHNRPMPKLYDSAAFKRSGHFRVSTSQVASVNEAFMCYGPLTPDGYACCYNPRDNDIIFSLAAFRDCQETCADRFAAALQSSLQAMHELLCRVGEKPSAKL